MSNTDIALFALSESHDFATSISIAIDVPLSAHKERLFEDGEHKTRPLVNVRGKDVFVIQSLYSDSQHSNTGHSVNDKLCRLLFFIGALRDASAERVTAIIPYLCYTRKDSKTQTRDPVTTRYVAALLESVGVDRVVTLDVHNLAAFQNAFRCHTDHLEARKLFVDYCDPWLKDAEVTVVSPDIGGIKRAERFRQVLSRRLEQPVAQAFMEKHRALGKVSGETLVGQVKDRVAIIIDDMIVTGGTLVRAARACRQAGAGTVYAIASHGLFVGDANDTLRDPALERIIVTDSVPAFRLDTTLAAEKLTVLDTSPLFAETIRRIHNGGSLVELLEP